ncbi:MAG: tetratricopeptide repeat protein [Ignavibacteria bacterium]|nr:tetratricopeptide repeat protein [Ignavibacteria bacterium]
MDAVIRSPLIISILVLLFVLGLDAGAQSSADRDRLRMAQTYERSGDLRSAARLYQELHASSPTLDSYFQGVVRSLSGLQQYASLAPVVEEQMKIAPSVNTAILAGTLYARLGDMTAAENWWKKAIELSDDDETTHLMIGAEQSQLMLHAMALRSYKAARSINGDALAYCDEIGQLSAVTGDLKTAAREAVAMYGLDGDLVRVQRRLSILLSYDGGAEAISTELDLMTNNSTDVLRLRQWFYRQSKAWQKALDVTAQLDQMTKQRGQELLLFADGARMDDQYDVAIEAYSIIMKENSEQRYRMSAAYGSARALEQKLRRTDKITHQEAKIVVERYDDIISQYGQHPIAAEALYHSAILEDDVIGNMDGARERLMRLLNQWKGTTVSSDGALRLADIYLAMGRDADAISTLRGLASGPSVIVSDRADLARLRLADLFLWNGNLDSARSYYAPLAAITGSVASNDALDRLLLINLAQDDSATVIAIASAEGLLVRRHYRDAALQFVQAAASAKDNDLRDRARMNGAVAFIELHDDVSAEPLLVEILKGIPETIYGDRSLSLLADIQVRRGDTPSALKILNSLLVNYPRSILVPGVRDRIRVLRGDA